VLLFVRSIPLFLLLKDRFFNSKAEIGVTSVTPPSSPSVRTVPTTHPSAEQVLEREPAPTSAAEEVVVEGTTTSSAEVPSERAPHPGVRVVLAPTKSAKEGGRSRGVGEEEAKAGEKERSVSKERQGKGGKPTGSIPLSTRLRF
jgi:hypothetical protein